MFGRGVAHHKARCPPLSVKQSTRENALELSTLKRHSDNAIPPF